MCILGWVYTTDVHTQFREARRGEERDRSASCRHKCKNIPSFTPLDLRDEWLLGRWEVRRTDGRTEEGPTGQQPYLPCARPQVTPAHETPVRPISSTLQKPTPGPLNILTLYSPLSKTVLAARGGPKATTLCLELLTAFRRGLDNSE